MRLCISFNAKDIIYYTYNLFYIMATAGLLSSKIDYNIYQQNIALNQKIV